MPKEAAPPLVTEYHLDDDGVVPNNKSLPLLVYKHAVAAAEGDEAAAAFERSFERNGWSGCWRNGIYDYHHYHSVTHEALGIAAGRATVQLGGERGVTLDVEVGDALVIPAGVGHKNLGSSKDFLVVGAYPGGADYDMNTGKPGEREKALANIARVPLPDADPLFGPGGPLTEYWRALP